MSVEKKVSKGKVESKIHQIMPGSNENTKVTSEPTSKSVSEEKPKETEIKKLEPIKEATESQELA